MTLKFYVNNQTLSLNPAQKNIQIASDSKNYLIAKFIFQTTDCMTNKPKYALFSHNGKTYKKYLGIEEGAQVNKIESIGLPDAVLTDYTGDDAEGLGIQLRQCNS